MTAVGTSAPATGAAVTALRARGLGVRLGGRPILQGVDLEVRTGEVHGLIGPNGAGKSTLLRALAHLIRPDEGSVRAMCGDAAPVDVATLSGRERAKIMAFLPQDTGVDVDFTARDLVAMGRYAHLPRWHAPAPGDAGAVETALARAGVADLADRSARTLSGGQRQLVQLAKQLAQQPAVYLLDEPVSALDLAHQLKVVAVMTDLAAEGSAVVAVLHDITLASRACTQLTVLHAGRVHATGAPADVLTEDLLAEVYGVRAHVRPNPAGGVAVTPLHPLTHQEELP